MAAFRAVGNVRVPAMIGDEILRHAASASRLHRLDHLAQCFRISHAAFPQLAGKRDRAAIQAQDKRGEAWARHISNPAADDKSHARRRVHRVDFKFCESFPTFTVQIIPCTSLHALELIAEDEVDLALFVEPQQSTGVRFIPLAEDELHFLVNPIHPWTKRGAVRDVAKQRFILPERTNETHSLVDAYFQQEGVSIKAFIEIGNEEAIKQFVRLDLGVGLLPRWIAANEIRQGTLASVPLGRGHLRRNWGILHCTNHELTFPESVFVNLCRTVAVGLMNFDSLN